MNVSEDIRKMAVNIDEINLKEFLKSELDKLDRHAFWEIEGTGNTDFVISVMKKYAKIKTVELDFAIDHARERDLEFLKGIKETFGKAREDKTVLEYAEEMIDDWIFELEELLD